MERTFFFSLVAGAIAVGLVSLAGCNAQVETVLSSSDGGPTATSDGASGPSQWADAPAGTTKECAAQGGVCLPADESAPPNRKKTEVPLCLPNYECWVPVDTDPVVKNCTFDAECNEDPKMSSLMGSCFEGMCMCHAPYHVQPNGKCGTAPAPGCTASAGTCRQEPAECQAGELESALTTNQSCGDFIPAVCCYAAATCKTTVDFVCCGANIKPYEPTCVNGWRTCAAGGPMPMLRKATCN